MVRTWATGAVLSLLCGCALTQDGLRAQIASGDSAQHLDVLSGPAACREQIARPTGTAKTLAGSEIRITSWNVQKSGNRDWQPDFARITEGADLVLMQEAALSEERITDLDASRHWSFAPGYRQGRRVSGVMTLSQAAPLTHCSLVSVEPLLGTPKATAITEYALDDSSETLVVVNLHAVNFSLGLGAYRRQFAQVEQALAGHTGPLIVSGDFNTWRPARSRVIRQMAARLGLTPVNFAADGRTRFWGQPLDHVFVRGLTPIAASTVEVTTSDHNPLSVTLQL